MYWCQKLTNATPAISINREDHTSLWMATSIRTTPRWSARWRTSNKVGEPGEKACKACHSTRLLTSINWAILTTTQISTQTLITMSKTGNLPSKAKNRHSKDWTVTMTWIPATTWIWTITWARLATLKPIWYQCQTKATHSSHQDSKWSTPTLES